MGYFFLNLSFFVDKCEVLQGLTLKQPALAARGMLWVLDGFLTARRTGRCSRCAIPPAVGHKYGFVGISVVQHVHTICCILWFPD